MGRAASIYQKLVGNCKNSLDGLVDFSDQDIHEEVIELFQLLYKQAYRYFRSRHAADAAEDLAVQAAQTVWENLLTCSSLSRVRHEDAFIGFARKSILYECWRAQKKYENEKIIDEAQDESGAEDDDDWLQALIDRGLLAGGADFGDPQGFFRQFTDCLIGAVSRLKNSDHRAVIVLSFLAGLDDRKLAFILGKPVVEVQELRARACAHGLDAKALGKTFGVAGKEIQAMIDQLRQSGIKDEAIAHICGVAVDRAQSLRSRARKLGLAADHEKVLCLVFHLSPASLADCRTKLKAHPIKKFEIALIFETVLVEMDGTRVVSDGGLAEDYEIALILGTTRSNVQAMFSRAKQSLRDDREFLECIRVD